MTASKRSSHCNKRPFTDLLAAQIAVRKTLSKARKRGEPIVTGLSPYKCEHCPDWHIGRSQRKGIDWDAVRQHDEKVHAEALKRRS